MTPKDIRIKIYESLFELLVTGKEVTIPQSDGSRIYMILEDMEWQKMVNIIIDVHMRKRNIRRGSDG